MVMSNPLPSASWKLEMADTTKFSYLAKDESGNETRRGGLMRKCIVVVSIPTLRGTTDKVAFIKTSRSKTYKDSRGKKIVKTDEWGEKTERIGESRLDHATILAEFTRWLGASEADRALQALQF